MAQTQKKEQPLDESSGKNIFQEPEILPRAIDHKTLAAVLKSFAEQLKQKGSNAEAALLSKGFEIRENNIVFKVSSLLEEDLISTFKQDLTQSLRIAGNSNLMVITEIEATESKKMIYTNKEKFEHLASKKPILKEFKDRLGLDTDF